MSKNDLDTLRDYVVTATGYVAGVPRKKGDTVRLSPSAAKYENVTEAGTSEAAEEVAEQAALEAEAAPAPRKPAAKPARK